MQTDAVSSSRIPAPGELRRQALEAELVNLFTRLVQIVGLPRSLAEIYAILFASSDSLCMEDVIARTGLSQGAVSQGLRQLRAFGAIQTIYATGDRRTFFAIEDNLRKVAAGFLKEQVLPQIEDWPARIGRIRELAPAAADPDNPTSPTARIAKLQGWHQRLRETLPEVVQLIGKWS